MIIALLLAVAAAAPPCFTVQADKITGRDLAKTSPLFADVATDAFVGYTPAPGRSRTFRPEELKRFSDSPDVPTLCFAWAVDVLEPARVKTAMLGILGAEGAEIEVLEVSRDPVPAGDVLFVVAGLPSTSVPGGAVIWRGQVRYGGNRRCDIWARVKVLVPYIRVVAVAPIKTGDVIAEAQVRVDNGKGMPSVQQYAVRLEDVVGRVSRRSFAEGNPITRAALFLVPEIRKGDQIQVKVHSGATRLQVEGRAESSGSVGDTVAVRNPASGKVFRARVERAGVATVDAGKGR